MAGAHCKPSILFKNVRVLSSNTCFALKGDLSNLDSLKVEDRMDGKAPMSTFKTELRYSYL